MNTYFTTRHIDEIEMREVHPGDRIIRLIHGESTSDSEPSGGPGFDAAVEREWTGEHLGRTTRHAASASPRVSSSDGATVVLANHDIGLTWPGAEAGALQVFIHPDWPGSYRSVNLSPRFWDKDLLSFDDIKLRAELLPDDPRPIPGVPRSGFGTSCLRCNARTDLRHSFGHAWRQGDVVLRIGTSEIIAHSEGTGMTDQDGNYCGDCIKAGFLVELKVPDGRKYNQYLNRSLPSGHEIPALAKTFLEPEDLVESCMWRYGRDTFEWSLETDPAACRERLDRARAIFASWSEQWTGFRRRKPE